jgi:hypothetical protein
LLLADIKIIPQTIKIPNPQKITGSFLLLSASTILDVIENPQFGQ